MNALWPVDPDPVSELQVIAVHLPFLRLGSVRSHPERQRVRGEMHS